VPIITITTAGLIGLLLLILSLRVVQVRQSAGVSLGDGGDTKLLQRIRAHANLTEYAPIILILLFLAEGSFGSGWFVGALAVLFLLARIAHPVGMAMPAPNLPRVLGTAGTWTVLAVLSLGLLWQSLVLHGVFQ
jgi:hypothetical protein